MERGWLGEWVAEPGWGPRLEAEQNGVVAWKACRQRSENHPEGRDCRIRDGEHRPPRERLRRLGVAGEKVEAGRGTLTKTYTLGKRGLGREGEGGQS